MQTLLNFVRLYQKAHEENYKQAELKKDNAQREIPASRLSGKYSFNTKVNLDGVENQKGKLELGATRIKKANVYLSRFLITGVVLILCMSLSAYRV